MEDQILVSSDHSGSNSDEQQCHVDGNQQQQSDPLVLFPKS